MPDPYISEVKYLGSGSQDFIELAVDEGTDVSNLVLTVYNVDGSVRTVNALETYAGTEFGKDIYLVSAATSSTFNGLHRFGGLSLSDSSTDEVFQFVSFSDRGSPLVATEGAADDMTAADIGEAGSGESLQTTDEGASYTVETDPNPGTIPCFLAGTRIATPQGAQRVEHLRDGDKVLGADGRVKRLRLVISRRIGLGEALASDRQRPICIRAGALGQGLPERDLFLSRQHRVLISSPIVSRMFGVPRVLAAAARLLPLPGVELAPVTNVLTYFHLILQDHDVLLAEGAPCESYLVAPNAVMSAGAANRNRIVTAFPGAADATYVAPSCVPIPSLRDQKRLIERHVKNRKDLLVSYRRSQLHMA